MKNMLIAGIVGLAFMVGGFLAGMKLNPPPKPKPAPMVDAKPVDPILPPKDPISVDDLKKTSESMMSLNQALKLREDQVAEREQKVRAKEDELAAERTALDSSHGKFKALFAEFKQRLDLVEANQLDDLHKQADLYSAMGDQAIDLLRPMDDAAVTRLFSVMDVKPLSKLIGLWKTKYPADAPRLMKSLDDMAKVMPKDKIAMDDPALSAAPDTSAPARAATDANTPAAPAAPVNAAAPTAQVPTPASDAVVAASPDATASAAPAPDASAPTAPPSLAPPPDPSPSQIPAGKVPETSLPNGPRPAAASTDGNAPGTVGAPVPTASASPDISTPGATASTPLPDPGETLPNNQTPPVALPVDSSMNPTRAPRALPVTINTAVNQ